VPVRFLVAACLSHNRVPSPPCIVLGFGWALLIGAIVAVCGWLCATRADVGVSHLVCNLVGVRLGRTLCPPVCAWLRRRPCREGWPTKTMHCTEPRDDATGESNAPGTTKKDLGKTAGPRLDGQRRCGADVSVAPCHGEAARRPDQCMVLASSRRVPDPDRSGAGRRRLLPHRRHLWPCSWRLLALLGLYFGLRLANYARSQGPACRVRPWASAQQEHTDRRWQ
jgi:hypothetical protein